MTQEFKDDDIEIDDAECPTYKSETYYRVVVLGTHQYKGWKCNFVGDGAMHFKHDSGDEKKLYRGREVANWMEECWSEFLEIADRYNLQNNQTVRATK